MSLRSIHFLLQNKFQNRNIAQYEKKIQELTSECKMKSDECYEAWMSLTDANEQLRRLNIELDNKLFQNETLGKKLTCLWNYILKQNC